MWQVAASGDSALRSVGELHDATQCRGGGVRVRVDRGILHGPRSIVQRAKSLLCFRLRLAWQQLPRCENQAVALLFYGSIEFGHQLWSIELFFNQKP